MEVRESLKFSRMTIPELEEQLRQRDTQIKEQAARIKELEKEIEELKKLLVEKAKSKESKPPKEATNYSVARHERKQRKSTIGSLPSRIRRIFLPLTAFGMGNVNRALKF